MVPNGHVAGALVLFATACATAHGAVGELGVVPSGAAQVCVVRPDALAGHVSMVVRDNGRLVGATRGNTFVCWLARTGDHQITSSDDDTGPLLLRARSGARYFLHQDVMELAGEVHAHLDWVEERAALDMLEACEQRVRVAVPGHDDEPFAQRIAPATSAFAQPTERSSTSNTSVEPGGMTGGKPRSP